MSRSLVAHSLKFNRKRHPDEAIAPSDLENINLLDHFERFFNGCTFCETRDEYHQTMIERQNYTRLNDESCLMHLSVAKWGEESKVLNPNDYADVRYEIQRDDPVSTVTRAYCHVPLNGETAFFFSEYSDRVSAGVNYLALFRKDFVHSVPTVTIHANRVYGAEEWLRSATLAELSINVKKKSSDSADRTSSYSGTLGYVVKPDKFTIWGKRTLEQFIGKNEDERRATLIEVAEDFGFSLDDADSIEGKLTLRGEDGKTTTFSLDQDPRAPYLYIPINNPDGTELSDTDFVAKCQEMALDYSGRY
ncbi:MULTISPECIES: hypothetical protein [unclassified Adlercreutzia]|uniref:hypothetical protein n=1 Tax=unclassified Adlercreutzia TaxID=2636013 RepID=UPI0013EA90F5|nr:MULTISPECIES: hypothetical protein [unclassified Adlercreutzia]